MTDTEATANVEPGETEAAGQGLTDEQFAQKVAGQTSSDLAAKDVFAREADGVTTDREAAKADGDDLAEGG